MTLNRRRLLLGAAGGLALTLGGLALLPGAERPLPDALQALQPRHHAALMAVAEALLPGGEGLPTPEEADVGRFLDEQLALGPRALREDILRALDVLESALTGLLLDGRPRPFSTLPPEARRETLLAWSEGPFELQRAVARAVCSLVNVAYWSSPAVHAGVGYPGPPVVRP